MESNDTLNLSALPFYQWDSVIAAQPQEAKFAGVAMMDSVFSQEVPSDSLLRTSLFTGHSLKRVDSNLIPRHDTTMPSWLFVLLLALTALLTLYYRSHKLRLSDLLASLTSSRTMDRTLRNNNLLRTALLIPAALLMTACVALPVHQTAMAHTGVGGYLLLWAGLSAAYLLRNGVVRLLGSIFDNTAAIEIYLTSNYLYHLTLATLLLPLLFPYLYLPWGHDTLFYILAGIVVVELVMRLFRGLQLFLTQSKSAHLFLFYYLCIVELVPILVLAKWLIE